MSRPVKREASLTQIAEGLRAVRCAGVRPPVRHRNYVTVRTVRSSGFYPFRQTIARLGSMPGGDAPENRKGPRHVGPRVAAAAGKAEGQRVDAQSSMSQRCTDTGYGTKWIECSPNVGGDA